VLPPRRLPALPAAALLVMALAACDAEPGGTVEDAKLPTPSTAPATPDSGGAGEGLPLAEALDRLQAAQRSRSSYQREKFRPQADAGGDGCDTRRKVLLAEAIRTPDQTDGCTLTGGR